MHTLFVISAPSGCGKGSLIKEILSYHSEITLSISHTTRVKRDNEIHGKDYFFISIEEFKHLMDANTFVEHAKVFGNAYGTSKDTLLKMLKNSSVIIEIDWQGARQIKKHFSNIVTIFIMPPSINALKERLTLRGDSINIINKRMQEAESEMSHHNEYDYIIVNDDFSTALKELDSIISHSI